jgi:hypothetical protein
MFIAAIGLPFAYIAGFNAFSTAVTVMACFDLALFFFSPLIICAYPYKQDKFIW